LSFRLSSSEGSLSTNGRLMGLCRPRVGALRASRVSEGRVRVDSVRPACIWCKDAPSWVWQLGQIAATHRLSE